MASPPRPDREGATATGPVAYFSPEFGVAAALPQYSGGLGILAGDHLKACADAGLDVVGVGLFYREGYFQQHIAADGTQEVRYLPQEPEALGLAPAGDGAVRVREREARFRVWRRDVGSVPLFLLDTDVPANDARERVITDRLYGGDREQRLRQEIVMGMGGLAALDAVEISPAVFHLNEGHAGFLALERIRRHVTATGAPVEESVEALRPSTIFTTHTPVPAGIDRFSRSLMHAYFARWTEACGVELDDLMALGALPGEREFNMAAFCLRIAGRANGVSRLHGEVSRRMFAPLWRQRRVEQVPIGHVTNGVHARTWTSPELQAAFEDAIGPGWAGAGPDAWEGAAEIDDATIRSARRSARRRLAQVLAERGLPPGITLDDEALTVGFARRFATYKRAALLLDHRDRLERLLVGDGRPVQLVFAGKAHPADQPGQDVLSRVAALAGDPAVKGRVFFVENYDIAAAQALVAGCDVWLNNPVRGEEACGTSGEKAALNGALNCSILDGWWDEMFDGDNGWAIPSREDVANASARNRAEAAAALDVLEDEVVPLYYDAGPAAGSPPSPAWLDRVRRAWISLGPRVTAARMVRDYDEQLYAPARSGA